MGRRGPPPTPSALKALAGNPGKRPPNRREPRPSADMPLCPTWLDDEAKAEWNRLVPELHRLGLLTVVDGAALAGYCQAFADFRDAVEALAKEGKTTATSTGYLAPHPAVAMKNKAMMLMRAFASEFGLSPASRSRVQAPEAKAADPMEEFLRGAG